MLKLNNVDLIVSVNLKLSMLKLKQCGSQMSSYYLQTIPIFAVGTFESPIKHNMKHVMPMTTVV